MKNLSKCLCVAAITFAAASSVAFADDNIRFVPEPYPIGQADQGEVKHVVLKGANVSGKEINLESVMGQGVGMSNFKFPKKIAKGAAVAIEFDMDFAGMDGQINPVVVMVGTDGTPYTATLDGFVKAPIFFGEKLFDTGFYAKGDSRRGPGKPPRKHRSSSSTRPVMAVHTSVPPCSTNAVSRSATPGRSMYSIGAATSR